MEKNRQTNAQKWKKPDEIIRLHRLKQKQKALQARLNGPTINKTIDQIRTKTNQSDSDGSGDSLKRRNPFAKEHNENAKREKLSNSDKTEQDDSIFKFLEVNTNEPVERVETINKITQCLNKASELQEQDNDLKFEKQKPCDKAPIDWSLKTKLRIMTKTVVLNNYLKTSQEASGITSFVRCLDPATTSIGLDISPSAQFYQSTMFWQHPHLPWLTLFPRSIKSNNNVVLGDVEQASLTKEWIDSFRALFQLLRARQCPYFYVCANNFSVLFRAAGIGGLVETHAMLTPTSRGMRAALKQESIEYTMPLRKEYNDKQNSIQLDEQHSILNDTSTMNISGVDENALDYGFRNENTNNEDHRQWLEDLGVNDTEIRKLNLIQSRLMRDSESKEDFTDQSLIFVKGVECQALFNFLLNSKRTTAKVGKLAGIPPTLLAPVSFPGATLRKLQIHQSQIRMNDTNYHSLELSGIVLPHILPYLCMLLKESKEAFSASMTSSLNTISFSKTARHLINDLNKENNVSSLSDHVFGRENLSDCGLLPSILESFCRISPDAVRSLERICYNREIDGFLWSELQ